MRSSTDAAAYAAVVVAVVIGLTPRPAAAISIVVDYSYDSQDFFGAGNPDGAAAGAQARTALEAAAGYFSRLLEDSFSPIAVPPPYNSGVFNGQVTWTWSHSFFHPGTGLLQEVVDDSFMEDEYRIYAGGRSLSGSFLGRGGSGGFGWSSIPSGGFTASEISEINAITDAFDSAVSQRGEPSGFAAWGGHVAFDNDGTADWHYDHTVAPTGSQDDFFSVALHEIGHAIGIGSSLEWNSLLSNGAFVGASAMAAYGGPVPADLGHFEDGVLSTIRGTSAAQEAVMDPTLAPGTRKLWTTLDAAALGDIGWQVAAIPEPSSLLLATLAALGIVPRKRPAHSGGLRASQAYSTSNSS